MITTNAISLVPETSRRNPHIGRIAIFQIISGGLSLVLGIIGVIWYSVYYFQVGAGIWGSLLTIATGVVGYQTAKKNAGSYVTHTAYMVLNIISGFLIAGAIFCTSVAAANTIWLIDCNPEWWYWCWKLQPNARPAWGTSMILTINLSATFVASIIGSVFSCFCCESCINSSARCTIGQQIDEDVPKKRGSDPPSYDSLQ